MRAALWGAGLLFFAGVVLRALELMDRWVFLVFAVLVLVGPPLVWWMEERSRTRGRNDRQTATQGKEKP